MTVSSLLPQHRKRNTIRITTTSEPVDLITVYLKGSIFKISYTITFEDKRLLPAHSSVSSE
jgi:hypothetical protein